MKELTVISGKGGTGKTSITAAFASLAKDAVFADCDVDAADLHLLLKPTVKKTLPFYGLKVASIDSSLCTKCKKCHDSCHFHAIDENIQLSKQSCEGCGFCAFICPVHAITMIDRQSGVAYLSETRFGPMAHAALHTAEEASGKLVTMVRTLAQDIAKQQEKKLIIIDGPPGIGCPVIASITGVDLVVIVTEPTLSAIHDLQRIIGVAHHFHIPAVICINKSTINPENTAKIQQYCEQNTIPIVGILPYDTTITQAMIHGQSITEFSNGTVSKELRAMWKKILEVLHPMGKDQLDTLVKNLQKKIQDDEEKTYSKTVIREYRNPTKFGILKQPDAMGIIKGPCGDTMKVTLQIVNQKIKDARFWTDGCGATLASGNKLIKMSIGKTPNEALGITKTQLIDSLGGLSQAHHHCALLAVNTLHQALKMYKPREEGNE